MDRARWDTDAVRDAVRSYLTQALAGLQERLVVDEIGFLKKGGRLSAGTAPVLGHGRASGELPARRVPGLRRTPGAALIDRELYLPRSWIDDPGRCAQAGIPDERRAQGVLTKPGLAEAMIARALESGVQAG